MEHEWLEYNVDIGIIKQYIQVPERYESCETCGLSLAIVAPNTAQGKTTHCSHLGANWSETGRK